MKKTIDTELLLKALKINREVIYEAMIRAAANSPEADDWQARLSTMDDIIKLIETLSREDGV